MEKSRIILFLSLFSLLFIFGCANTADRAIYEYMDNNSARITTLEQRLDVMATKLGQVEEKQLTTADLLSVTTLKKQNKTQSSDYDDSSLPQGCPTSQDVDFWFEQNITENQMNKILDKYNSETCRG